MTAARFFAFVSTATAVAGAMNALSALLDGNISATLGWVVAAMFAADLAARRFDQARIADHQEFTRTWRFGQLASEYRTDVDGQQSGTFYGVSR